MRRQVPALGVVMIVLGLLNMVLYILYLLLTLFGVTANLMQNSGYTSDADQIGQLVGGGMSMVWVGVWVLGGLLWALAGARIRRFRGRGFAIAVLLLGVLPCCFSHVCCTWVFDMGVGIWGLVVLLNADTAQAFRDVAEGAFPDEVLT